MPSLKGLGSLWPSYPGLTPWAKSYFALRAGFPADPEDFLHRHSCRIRCGICSLPIFGSDAGSVLSLFPAQECEGLRPGL